MKQLKQILLGKSTPDEVADLIKDIIQDKVVCDVGCGDGSFMLAMSKYASKVIGIEHIPERAEEARQKGFEVITGSSFFAKLPEADVYYLWSRDAMGAYLKAKHEGTKGTFIFGMTVRVPLLNLLLTLKPEKRVLAKKFIVYICEL